MFTPSMWAAFLISLAGLGGVEVSLKLNPQRSQACTNPGSAHWRKEACTFPHLSILPPSSTAHLHPSPSLRQEAEKLLDHHDNLTPHHLHRRVATATRSHSTATLLDEAVGTETGDSRSSFPGDGTAGGGGRRMGRP